MQVMLPPGHVIATMIAEHPVKTESHHRREEQVLLPELEKRGIEGPPSALAVSTPIPTDKEWCFPVCHLGGVTLKYRPFDESPNVNGWNPSCFERHP
jgi:hypothetical protein